MNSKKPIADRISKIPSPIMAALSGLLIVLALPPVSFHYLAFVALIPIIYSLYKDNFYFGFTKGFIFGLILNLGILYWLGVNQGTVWYFAFLSMLGAVLFLAVQYGLLFMLVAYIGRSLGKKVALWTLPVLIAGFDFITSRGVLGFTWNSLCYTQSNNLIPAQMASLFGCYGLSLWVVLVNVSLFSLINKITNHKKLKTAIVITITIFMIPYLFGGISLIKKNDTNNPKIKVGLVQPNVDPTKKWIRSDMRSNIQTLFSLSDSAAQKTDLDLLVWPETAVPAYIRYRSWVKNDIQDYIIKNNVSLITGVPDFLKLGENEYEFYNSTFFLTPDNQQIESYNKIKLVPFGEKIPLSNIFESLENLNLGQGNFDAGDSIKLFEVPLKSQSNKKDQSILCSSAICYESGFSDLVSQGVRKGSHLLVIVTNDAWFGNTSAPYLHAAIARLRAIENRIPVVRAANTGISMIIDKKGRLLQRCGFDEKCSATANLEVRSGTTLYTRIGRYFNWLLVGAGIIVLIISIWKGRQENKQERLI